MKMLALAHFFILLMSWVDISDSWTSKICSGAYVHIPFCRNRCGYCNFAIHIVPGGPDPLNRKALEYSTYVVRDIDNTVDLHPSLLSPLKTLYFGGGTPSLLPIEGLLSNLS